MIHLGIRTEFSFRQTFGKIDETLAQCNSKSVGIADINSTYGHVRFQAECKEKGIKPIFGVRLEVLPNDAVKTRGVAGPTYIFFAKNESGLEQIYSLTTKAWSRFYYKPFIIYNDIEELTDDVIVIATSVDTLDYRIDYIGLTPRTSPMMLDLDIPLVYIQDNFFPTPQDRGMYHILAGSQKRKDQYYFKFNDHSTPQHILCEAEFNRIWKSKQAAKNTKKIAKQCNVSLPRAPMVRYEGDMDLVEECKIGAKQKGINLKKGKYAKRFKRELKMIQEKEYDDYFLIVSDMIKKAKETMLVGPSRGSSAGSLICYLMGITEIDPVRFGLVFKRFIDINRPDLPDIDVDFPDERRQEVIEYLFKTYGSDNVCHIANINEYKAKSVLDDVGLALQIPKWEVNKLKDSIVDRSGGDARAAVSVQDTLETTDVGKQFVEEYPAIKNAERLQNHATHFGKHAAGIIVCNEPINKFGAVNSREGAVMMDKKDAESLNLLKIDALGLRTLSIIQDCAEYVGLDWSTLYSMDLDDQKAFSMFQQMRLNGIFQFEGQAMRLLCEKMGVENFNYIVAITALARPGPLHSGGADKFIRRRTGQDEVEYISNHPSYIKHTEETYGIIVYQEQLMNLCKDIGNMTWEEVTQIRKAASKTYGKEFFNKYKDSFLNGTRENGIPDEEAVHMWENMMTFGSWGMNKSHTVSYGYISYWCAYMKAHHPLEFAMSNLNHTKDEERSLKILRDAYENDGIEYVSIDTDESDLMWSVKNGTLYGGMINIKGVGEKKAKDLIKAREGKMKFTTSMLQHMAFPETPYDILYPCKHYWGDIYDNHGMYGLASPPDFIKNVNDSGSYLIIGQVKGKDLRDLNEYNEVMKRGGKVYDKDNLFLKIIVADDTDQIQCKIDRKDFVAMKGQELSDKLVDNTWVIIRGKIRDGNWRILLIQQISILTELYPEGLEANVQN